jgi:hypothetical protein
VQFQQPLASLHITLPSRQILGVLGVNQINLEPLFFLVFVGADPLEDSGGDWTGQPWALPRGVGGVGDWAFRLGARSVMRSIRRGIWAAGGACDFASRGEGGSNWGYATIQVVEPLLGGVLAGWLLRVLAAS